MQATTKQDELPQPWGGSDAWVPITTPEQLDVLAPMLDR
jgi:hypothetical protein